MGAGGLIWMRRDAEGLQSPIAKFLSDGEKGAMEKKLGVSAGDVIFMMADKRNRVNDIMGRFRSISAKNTVSLTKVLTNFSGSLIFRSLNITRKKEI
jgi:aspartyl-tRNA synthetase